MARAARKNGHAPRTPITTKYDANNLVLEKTYGAFADLRRELADTKAAVSGRTEVLQNFSECGDPQRAWLLLEDYLERLSLSRKDFAGEEWWPRLLAVSGKARLEETALMFLRANRPLPTELLPHANLERFAEIEESEQDQQFVRQLESWLLPPPPAHLDSPRAALRVRCAIRPVNGHEHVHGLGIEFSVIRSRSGEKPRTAGEVIELTTRATHEQEMFSPGDWEFIQWLADSYEGRKVNGEPLVLAGSELLQWLARWGDGSRLELAGESGSLRFHGEIAELRPHLEQVASGLSFTHRLRLPNGRDHTLDQGRFLAGPPAVVLVGRDLYLVRNAPPGAVLSHWSRKPALPVQKLSHRLLTHLRKTGSHQGANWEQLCVAHSAVPQFIFELTDDTVRLRLLARSERDQSVWQWNGHEWQPTGSARPATGKPEILDDPRLEPATHWLRRLDWFTPEPALWVGDANENFLNTLAFAWPDRPTTADYLGNPAFQRLFLAPRVLRPKLIVQGSGIDWLSVSAEWEQEGMKLTPADLRQLQTATGRFVKLPDGGWIQLDAAAVERAHETMADLGLDGLDARPQKVALLHAAQMSEDALGRFGADQVRMLRQRVAEFQGVAPTPLPEGIQAEMRPYQKAGFDFLCHLTRLKLGGILADDMGLGKTLQTLAWLAWLQTQGTRKARPALVICPASVLHNWRREAERFAPNLKVLVLESGSERHNLRRQIPQHDLIVTNYALLRRDLEALQKFEFRGIVLDEAQFIKNPAAQVTQSVKQLRADQRLALTGTPLENRLLDLWSIIDFVQPGYLGSQTHFAETYEPRGENADLAARMARRRLAARIRPILLRRLKRQVAQDLPDRIEERRDCELGEQQRKLYLAELRRSREKVLQTVAEKGVARSKIHVLAALTRLRQICCHPELVGNDSASGKTETLFELLEPLLEEGQKVLVFSQFVQMLELIEKECKHRQIPTHVLTGETKQRQEVVNAFQDDPNAAVFLLSLRAAGTGLNLTTASYVVLYDPWWNPAVEAQAIDRSHRIGQTRTVNAYRLIAPGTVEEKIWELQQRKAQTISDVLGEEGFARSLSQSDLEYLFSED